jgi:hypothetical protein
MKQWKKYLAAAAIPVAILALVLIVQNSAGKKDTVVGKSSTLVNESIQTGADNAGVSSTETDNTAAADNATEGDNGLLAAEASPYANENTAEENQSMSEEEIKAEIDNLINTYYNISGNKDSADSKTAEQSAEDTKTAGNDKINEIIEEYRNIKNYVKPGLDSDSYVVFTTYEIKVVNIDTLVPGMSSLSVVRDENGNLTVKDDPDNKKLNDYIQKLAKEKDIMKIVKGVNSKLTAAVKKDNSLQVFIDYLK